MKNPIAVAASALTLLMALCTGLIWAADTRYVSYTALDTKMAKQRLLQVNDEIAKLEIKVKYGEATKADEVTLQLYHRKRQELLGE